MNVYIDARIERAEIYLILYNVYIEARIERTEILEESASGLAGERPKSETRG